MARHSISLGIAYSVKGFVNSRYMAETLPMRRKTLYNQSIKGFMRSDSNRKPLVLEDAGQ